MPFADRKHVFLYALLVLAAIYTSWLVQQTTARHSSSKMSTNYPDAFLETVTAVQMDKDGKPHTKLTSPNVIHYPLNDTALFTDPHFVLYSEKQNPWHMTALHGRTTSGVNKIDLWGNVVLHQDPGPHNKNLTMKTSYLAIFPKKNYAETTHAVTFIEPNTRLTAVGMHAFLDEKRVELLTNTRGIHDKLHPLVKP